MNEIKLTLWSKQFWFMLFPNPNFFQCTAQWKQIMKIFKQNVFVPSKDLFSHRNSCVQNVFMMSRDINSWSLQCFWLSQGIGWGFAIGSMLSSQSSYTWLLLNRSSSFLDRWELMWSSRLQPWTAPSLEYMHLQISGWWAWSMLSLFWGSTCLSWTLKTKIKIPGSYVQDIYCSNQKL